jgi:hypothetical protein
MPSRSQSMIDFEFDPALMLEGDVVIVTLDDAAAFARTLVRPRLPRTRESVVRWLERAHEYDQQSKAADMFRFWVKSEGVLHEGQ